MDTLHTVGTVYVGVRRNCKVALSCQTYLYRIGIRANAAPSFTLLADLAW